MERDLRRLARDEVSGAKSETVVVRSDDTIGEVVRRADASDLLILGLHRAGRRGRRVFGQAMLQIAQATDVPLLMISQRE